MTADTRFSGLVRAALAAALALPWPGVLAAQSRVEVVATLPTYASIAREIAGDLADVEAIARGDEDPHFVQARPSFARMIQRADLFISTGLDLELWVPALLDRANNAAVLEGAPGAVVAYSGVELLDRPASVSRSEGDVHVFGNPHIHTDPINAILIGRNILAGLERVDAGNAATYRTRARDFENRVIRRLFGDRLADMLGEETLFRLARGGTFWSFAEEQEFEGRPLTEFVEGWLAEAAPFRDRRMACYHKNWAYFSDRFRVECAIYVEPKPGIPPTPGHVRDVIAYMRDNAIPVLFGANYYARSQIDRVAERTGAIAVVVPQSVDGAEGVDDYFALVDLWVAELARAFERHAVDGG